VFLDFCVPTLGFYDETLIYGAGLDTPVIDNQLWNWKLAIQPSCISFPCYTSCISSPATELNLIN